MRILYSSPADDATVTGSTSDSGFPANNVINPILANEWRTFGLSTAETLIFDAGSGNLMSANSVFLAAHNFSTAATVTWEMNATDSWGSPSVSVAITQRTGVMGAYFTDAAYRYARLLVQDGSNSDGYIRLGRVMAGEYLTVNPSSEYEHQIRRITTDRANRTPTGQVYTDVGIVYNEYQYDFPVADDDMKSAFETLFDTMGRQEGFFLVNFDTDWTIIEPDYVRMTSDLAMTRKGQYWTYNITMEGVQ